MSIAKTIFKNSAYLISGEVLSKVAVFFFNIIIARALGVAGVGKYTFAVSLVLTFSIIIDFGTNVFLLREIPRHKERLSFYIGNIFTMRLFFSAVFFVIMGVVVKALNYSGQMQALIYILSLWGVLIGFSFVFRTGFKAVERMEYEAAINLTYNILGLFFTLILLKAGFGIMGVAVSVCLAAMISLVVSLIFFWKRFSRFKLQINPSFWINTIKEALPLAVSWLLMFQFGKVDTLMLAFMQGDKAVGFYNAAFRLVMTLFFVYVYTTHSAFPKMSEYAFSAPEKCSQIAGSLLKSLFTVTLMISIGIYLFSPLAIKIIYGAAYVNSTGALKILCWVHLVNALCYVLLYVVNAKNMQKINVLLVAAAIIMDIVLNFILIPRYSYMGAAFATLISEIFLLCMLAGYVFGSKYVYLKDILFSMQDWRLIKGLVSIQG